MTELLRACWGERKRALCARFLSPHVQQLRCLFDQNAQRSGVLPGEIYSTLSFRTQFRPESFRDQDEVRNLFYLSIILSDTNELK